MRERRTALVEGVAGVDLRLWGKSRGLELRYPLILHLLDAAAAAECLWRDYLTPAQQHTITEGLGLQDETHAGRLVAFWAGLHDIGKLIPEFQAMDDDGWAALAAAGYPSVAPGQPPLKHDRAAHLALAPLLAARGYPTVGTPVSCVAHRIAQLLGGHHGTFHQACTRDQRRWGALATPALGQVEWEEQRAAHLDLVDSVLQSPKPPPVVTPTAASLVTGVIVVADWLVSQESFLGGRIQSGLPLTGDLSQLARHLNDSRRLVPGLLQAAGLGRACFVPGDFQQTFGFPPYPLQAAVVTELPELVSGPGLLLVMAPTGDGKTEVALHAARVLGEAAGTTGLHFALPTIATADQMFDRVVRYAQHRLADRAALALVHSGAWMDDRVAALSEPLGRLGPAETDTPILTDEQPDRSAPDQVVATSWLRGAKRGVLAPIAVGTIDQVLLAVLPVRHNALRLLGLAGKVLVVDEAHAYDAYMQALLRRVLAWLGALRVPVVLMSATLPASVAKTLVRAYLIGADPLVPLPDVPVSYPGWVHVDAASRKVTARSLPSTRARDLEVGLRPYGDDAERIVQLLEVLGPVRSGGGCALVVCNTVGEAQETREALARAFAEDRPERRPDLLLLHARFPRGQRAELTSRVERLFGKDSQERPRAAVLIATQVAEQSLDLDFDLVVSDLAPMAQLLQRVGRGHRHERARPAAFHRPRLEVLVPVDPDGACSVPRRWWDIYDLDLLLRTQRLLSERAGQPVRVPDDVQAMVDGVYAGFEDETADERLLQLTLRRIAKDAAQAGVAQLVAVPRPDAVGDLAEFSRGEVSEDLIATRLGVDSVQVLCCFTDPSGRRFLDRPCTLPLPRCGSGPGDRFTRAEIRKLFAHTIPVRRGSWIKACGPEQAVPEPWRDEPRLADLVLLPHRVQGSTVTGPVLGATAFLLDPELGLRMTRQPHGSDAHRQRSDV